MTDTVRIMNSPDDGYVWVVPTHPVYATRSETGDWILSDDSAVAFDAESAIGIDGYWHEVSDPIVWDGTDDALEAIRAAFEGTANYASRDDNPSAGWGHSCCLWVGVGQQSSLVSPGWRIQIVGDSFAILPPEATA